MMDNILKFIEGKSVGYKGRKVYKHVEYRVWTMEIIKFIWNWMNQLFLINVY